MTQEVLPKATSEFRDNSMISGYKNCPRYFQLRYQFHWRSKGISLPLSFGLSWHAGMDAVWKLANKTDADGLAEMALHEFTQVWESQGLPAELDMEQLEQYSPRTPSVAHEMYVNYIEQRWNMIRESELLACEQPFAVPLPGMNDVWYAGRLDKVIVYRGEKLVIEHKTTSEYKKDGGFRSTYVDSWYTDSQCKGYQFGAGLYYPGVNQVWVDAALVHKKEHDKFKFIPVAHQFPLLAEWINDTKLWIERIQADVAKGYFPKNENSCVGKYGACSFLNICRTTSDPWNLKEPPEGYMVEKWSPFDVLKLDKLLKADQ